MLGVIPAFPRRSWYNAADFQGGRTNTANLPNEEKNRSQEPESQRTNKCELQKSPKKQ